MIHWKNRFEMGWSLLEKMEAILSVETKMMYLMQRRSVSFSDFEHDSRIYREEELVREALNVHLRC